jgi:hypothetical protein
MVFLGGSTSCSHSELNSQQKEGTDRQVDVLFYDLKQELRPPADTILMSDYSRKTSISIFDTLLVVKVSKEDYVYKVFHANRGNLLGKFGKRGEGPGEWKYDVYHRRQFDTNSESVFLWFYGSLQGFISKVNLTKSLEWGNYLPSIDTTINIDGSRFPFNHALVIDGGSKIFLTSGNVDPRRSTIKMIENLSNDSSRLFSSGLFPKIKNDHMLPSEALYSIYYSQIRASPDGSKVAQLMSTFDRVNIYTDSISPTLSIVGGENWDDEFYDARMIDVTSNFMEGLDKGYHSSAVTDKYIYGLRNHQKTESESSQSTVFVFDWEGRSVCKIVVPHKLFDLAVDANDRYMYATDLANDLVLRYDLGKVTEL